MIKYSQVMKEQMVAMLLAPNGLDSGVLTRTYVFDGLLQCEHRAVCAAQASIIFR